MQLDLSLQGLLAHGGVILMLLMVASVWSWYLIVERWLVFRRAERGSERLGLRVAKLARAGQIAEARELAQSEEGCVAALLMAGLAHGSKDKEVLDEALERKQAEELMALEHNLGTLGTLGSVAPYVGLFGTVLGIIRSFQSLGTGGGDAAGAAMVSAGIAESLVATAAGLAVAVPAVILFNAYSRRLTVLETRLSVGASELVEALTEKSRKGSVDA
jgi:biopolymer transport protein ExbB/TolQ